MATNTIISPELTYQQSSTVPHVHNAHESQLPSFTATQYNTIT